MKTNGLVKQIIVGQKYNTWAKDSHFMLFFLVEHQIMLINEDQLMQKIIKENVYKEQVKFDK